MLLYCYFTSTNNDRYILHAWLDKDYSSPGMWQLKYIVTINTLCLLQANRFRIQHKFVSLAINTLCLLQANRFRIQHKFVSLAINTLCLLQANRFRIQHKFVSLEINTLCLLQANRFRIQHKFVSLASYRFTKNNSLNSKFYKLPQLLIVRSIAIVLGSAVVHCDWLKHSQPPTHQVIQPVTELFKPSYLIELASSPMEVSYFTFKICEYPAII